MLHKNLSTEIYLLIWDFLTPESRKALTFTSNFFFEMFAPNVFATFELDWRMDAISLTTVPQIRKNFVNRLIILECENNYFKNDQIQEAFNQFPSLERVEVHHPLSRYLFRVLLDNMVAQSIQYLIVATPAVRAFSKIRRRPDVNVTVSNLVVLLNLNVDGDNFEC
jgi:hypothetical protein